MDTPPRTYYTVNAMPNREPRTTPGGVHVILTWNGVPMPVTA